MVGYGNTEEVVLLFFLLLLLLFIYFATLIRILGCLGSLDCLAWLSRLGFG